jgi:hypothetical protein
MLDEIVREEAAGAEDGEEKPQAGGVEIEGPPQRLQVGLHVPDEADERAVGIGSGEDGRERLGRMAAESPARALISGRMNRSA